MGELSDCLNYTQPPTDYALPFPEKFLIFDSFHASQPFINKILTNYPRLCDFHNDPPFFGPAVHILRLVAEGFNSSLVGIKSIRKDCNKILDRLPAIHQFKLGARLKNFFKIGMKEYPVVIQQPGASCNFIYCNRQYFEHENLSPFGIFRNSGEIYVWLCLLSSFILATYLIKWSISKDNSTPVMMAALSALISSGVSGETDALSHSWLFSLWTFVSLLFVNYYSGNLTSVVVSPAAEERMTNVIQLKERNYTLLVENPSVLRFLQHDVQLSLVGHNWSAESPPRIVESLLKSTIVAKNEETFPEMLATQEKVATVCNWMDSFRALSNAEKYIRDEKMERQKCYIGQELILRQNMFYVITPPESDKVARIFRRFVEAGFLDLWFRETQGIAVSKRVQGRRRIKSPTQIVEEPEEPKKLQLLEGKLPNVFLLWITCVLICLMGFIFENVWSQF